MAITRAPITFRCHEAKPRKRWIGRSAGDVKKNREAEDRNPQEIVARAARRSRWRWRAHGQTRRNSAGRAPIELWRALELRTRAGSERLHQAAFSLSVVYRRQVRRAALGQI